MTHRSRRVCPWCHQSEQVQFRALTGKLEGTWVAHVDPNVVPKGSLCEGSGRAYEYGRGPFRTGDGLGLMSQRRSL